MKKTCLFILFVCIAFVTIACNQESIDNGGSDSEDITQLQGNTLTDDTLIKWLGRTHYDSIENRQYFYHTASGFSVTFEGTSLSITIHASNTNHSNLRPYFSILLNNQSPDEGQILMLTQPNSTHFLVDNLDYGIHTLTFLKRSEARDSVTSISKIETDGTFLPPQKSFNLNILVLGGSGISGNGVFGSPSISRTTANSSSLHAFGYKTAHELNANVHFVASSGWGLKWGYNPTNAGGTVNIRTAFDKVGINDQQELVDIDFDYPSFVPDVIIINLGGNDYNAYIATLSGDNKKDAEKQFQDAVIEMVTTLNTLYPNAFIYWTHTSSINGTLASTVLSDLDPLRTFIEAVLINSPGSNNDPVGSGNHASEITHQRNADTLVEKIRQQLNIGNE